MASAASTAVQLCELLIKAHQNLSPDEFRELCRKLEPHQRANPMLWDLQVYSAVAAPSAAAAAAAPSAAAAATVLPSPLSTQEWTPDFHAAHSTRRWTGAAIAVDADEADAPPYARGTKRPPLSPLSLQADKKRGKAPASPSSSPLAPPPPRRSVLPELSTAHDSSTAAVSSPSEEDGASLLLALAGSDA